MKEMYAVVRKSDRGGAILAEPVVSYEADAAKKRMIELKKQYMSTEGWKCEDLDNGGFRANYSGDGSLDLEFEFSVLKLDVNDMYEMKIPISLDAVVHGEGICDAREKAAKCIEAIFASGEVSSILHSYGMEIKRSMVEKEKDDNAS